MDFKVIEQHPETFCGVPTSIIAKVGNVQRELHLNICFTNEQHCAFYQGDDMAKYLISKGTFYQALLQLKTKINISLGKKLFKMRYGISGYETRYDAYVQAITIDDARKRLYGHLDHIPEGKVVILSVKEVENFFYIKEA
jgi:hypothetical protein